MSKRPRVVIKVNKGKPIKIYPKNFLKNAVILFAILIIIFAFTSAKKVPYTEEEMQELKGDSYTVLVPYTEKEPYTVKEHFGKTVCRDEVYNYSIDYEMENQILETEDGEKKWHLVCTMTLLNKEDKPGEFTFRAVFNKKSGKLDSQPMTREVDAHSAEIFEWKEPMDEFGDIVACTPQRIELPEIERCFPLDPNQFTYVKKFRNVTKYRNETRYKNTKILQKDYKYINRVFGYEQFFYLGY